MWFNAGLCSEYKTKLKAVYLQQCTPEREITHILKLKDRFFDVLGIVEYFERREEVQMMKGDGGASICGGFSENV